MRLTTLLFVLFAIAGCGGGTAPISLDAPQAGEAGGGEEREREEEKPEEEDFEDPPLPLGLAGRVVIEVDEETIGEELDDDDAESAAVAAIAEQIRADYGLAAVERLGDSESFVLELAPGQDRDALIVELSLDPRIEEVELDVLGRAPEGGPSGTASLGSELIDQIRSQRSLDVLGLAQAHAIAQGNGIVVAVIDTGVDASHPLLRDRIAPGGFDFVDGDADPAEERNGRDDDGDGRVDEQYGHGTFIASLVLTGAPEARILPVRALNDDGIGTSSTVAQGIYWAVRQGAQVVNVSVDMPTQTAALQTALAFAKLNGVAVVAAVGNGRREDVVFPARVSSVTGVAAVDATGRAASFTNVGSEVDFVAPGVDIIGALPFDLSATGAGRWSGTSFATPFVAGIFALMAERFPSESPDEWRSRLAATARSVESLNPDLDSDLGFGWAQPAAALE